MSWNSPIWMKVLGISCRAEPRGVRAEFCEYCLTIAPHWAYDMPTELAKGLSAARGRQVSNSFQLCQICSARSELPSGAILASRKSAAALDIDKLIDRTNPGLWEPDAVERIQNMLAATETSNERRQFAMSAFAYSQQDQINDMTRVASIRVIAILLAALPIGGKLFQRAPVLVAGALAAVIPLAAFYRLFVVPLNIRQRLLPGWIRLLTGANISFGELQRYLLANEQKFPAVSALLRTRAFRRLGDDGLLHRDAAALQPGIDFLPPPRNKA